MKPSNLPPVELLPLALRRADVEILARWLGAMEQRLAEAQATFAVLPPTVSVRISGSLSDFQRAGALAKALRRALARPELGTSASQFPRVRKPTEAERLKALAETLAST